MRNKEWNGKISDGLRKYWSSYGYKCLCAICGAKLRSDSRTLRCQLHKSNEKRIFSEEHRKNISKSRIGKKQSKETLEKLSKIRKGKPAWNKGRKCPETSGEKNGSWKGGVNPENHTIRNSFEYAIWRTAVFQRDGYSCVLCGEHGGRLNADHIKPFALFPELRLALDNGRTLCVPCHKKTPTYGRKKQTKPTEVD